MFIKMPSCFVPSCTNQTHKLRKKPGVTFHRFPKTATMEWLRAIGRDPFTFIIYECVCSEHFRKEDFEAFGARKTLKANVIPSLNLPPILHEEVMEINSGSDTDQQDPLASCKVLMVNKISPNRTFLPFRSSSGSSAKKTYIQKSASSATASVKRIINTFRIRSLSSLEAKYFQKEQILRRRIDHYKRKLKSTRKRSIQIKRSIVNLYQVVCILQKRFALSMEAVTALENSFSGVSLSLMKRMLQHQSVKGKIARQIFPPELRSFAMTLKFYNTKAYNYLRRTFNMPLPSAGTISSWFSKLDCSPGYTQPSIQSLKVHAAEYKLKNNKQLLCSLMFDEISLKKELVTDRDTEHIRGYTDIGCDIDICNEQELATEALVLMVVGVNDNFKLPVAYFLINKITGEEKANLIIEALKQLHETGCKILSVTSGGPQVDFKMMQELGCRVTDPNDLKTYFLHPITSEKVFVVFDVCHMLKLVRNNWANSKEFVDPDGNRIKWQFIEELYKIQENEDLGNELRREHSNWKSVILKVNVTAQTLSCSVADALQFLSEIVQLEQFKDVGPTVKFIRTMARLFDLLNSRNPFGKEMKTPMKEANCDYWKPFLVDALEYLQKCKDLSEQPLYQTKKRIPFIGLIVSAKSLFNIYELEVVEKRSLKYLLTYKFSQDHLELFFCSVRSRNGWISNPNCQQFTYTYKRLLLNDDISNCLAQDQTNILILTKSMEPLTISDVHIARKTETANRKVDELEEEIQLFLPTNLKEYSTAVVNCIAGFVIRKLENQFKCSTCLEALSVEPAGELDAILDFANMRNKGRLTFASKSVRYICSKVERKIQLISKLCDGGFLPTEDDFIKMLLKENQHFIEHENIFVSLNEHVYDNAFEDIPHKKVLVDKIIKTYGCIRICSITSRINALTCGKSSRGKISELILFGHQ